eukprot:6465875-Pyramimonas_sp.AAC.1
MFQGSDVFGDACADHPGGMCSASLAGSMERTNGVVLRPLPVLRAYGVCASNSGPVPNKLSHGLLSPRAGSLMVRASTFKSVPCEMSLRLLSPLAGSIAVSARTFGPVATELGLRSQSPRAGTQC